MNERPLPSVGKERQIFIQALRHYSDTCEAPMLHADCPFSESVPTGRACAEQCMDLLAECGPARRPGEVDLGPGLSAYKRRPRARRMPKVPTKPFDAVEIHLSDVHKADLGSWRMPALIAELLGQLTTPPPNDKEERIGRVARIRSVLDEIGLRGVDAEGLVRFGLARIVAGTVVFTAAIPDAMPADIVEEMTELAAPTEWSDWLREVVDAAPYPAGRSKADSSGNYLGPAFASGTPKVLMWLETAPMEDIITWNIDCLDGRDAPLDASSEEHVTYGWLVDRFIRTYLNEWQTASLIAEYEYVHGERPGPCGRSDMQVRKIDRDELARMIADRTVRDHAGGKHTHPSTGAQYAKNAAEWLKQGERRKAAALFDALREMDPTDGDAHNNYGFCLLPDRPDEALAALQQAAGIGMTEMINAANRVLALGMLDRDAVALELAETALVEHGSQFPVWAWNPDLLDGKDPVLDENVEVREYVIALGLKIAQRTSDPVLIARWENRRDVDDE